MKSLLVAVVSLIASQPLFCQPVMPSWLIPYPGVTAGTKTYQALVEATYTTNAAPHLVTDHYRKLFEAQRLAFQANPDGVGTTIRGAAAECDLLIAIRAENAGISVRVSCAAKTPSYTTLKSSEVITTAGTPSRSGAASRTPQQSQEEHQQNVAAMLEQHNRRVAELGIHPVYKDAEAPPLIWPDWLVHIKGARLAVQQSVDQSKMDCLKSRFISSEPMTAIFTFYQDLLTSHGHPVHTSKLSTGQTISGIRQNAYGYVEGTNYPSGSPGPRTVIHVGFSRFKLNDPITVDLRFTPYPFHAPKREGF